MCALPISLVSSWWLDLISIRLYIKGQLRNAQRGLSVDSFSVSRPRRESHGNSSGRQCRCLDRHRNEHALISEVMDYGPPCQEAAVSASTVWSHPATGGQAVNFGEPRQIGRAHV